MTLVLVHCFRRSMSDCLNSRGVLKRFIPPLPGLITCCRFSAGVPVPAAWLRQRQVPLIDASCRAIRFGHPALLPVDTLAIGLVLAGPFSQFTLLMAHLAECVSVRRLLGSASRRLCASGIPVLTWRVLRLSNGVHSDRFNFQLRILLRFPSGQHSDHAILSSL